LSLTLTLDGRAGDGDADQRAGCKNAGYDKSGVGVVDQLSGTVTFLFTDIEGSTQRWQLDGRAMAVALAAHDDLIRSVVERHGGVVFKHTGDGMCAVFTSAPAAVAAAVEVQTGLELPVRIGLHTGEAESRDSDYFGPTLNRAARVMDAGHGGQVLVSSATAGLVPGHDLVDLGEHQLKGLTTPERIFQVGQSPFPALRTPRQVVGNLPVELSTFVGRTDEVTSLVAELADQRLVTLIGVGGTGKTRLAVETATTMSASFSDGVWMVELAPVMVEDAVPFAFAEGLDMTAPAEGDVVDHLVVRLRDKRCLVVVDNCEHVLAAAADVVERIVGACPTVTILATSREPLMVRGERLVPVPSLLSADAENLFLQRARNEAPDLVIDDDQRRAVTELCQRLDGLPLAVELAASRVRALTPVELVANLEERFRMLIGGRRSRMERHQTMRGTLDWSYDLCSDVEQAVFDRLSVFPAGFDLCAARAVAGGDGVDVIDVVPQLVDRSLLQRSTATDGTTRYRMLETMRAYGREHIQHHKLSDTIRERHARYMARTIGELSLRTLGPDEEQVSQRLSEHLPDALVALDWCIDHQEWDNGTHVIWAGRLNAAREADEMAVRLFDAAQAGGAPETLLVELEFMDGRQILKTSVGSASERSWIRIRSRPPIPSDRFVIPPYAEVQVTAADVDEYLASLDHWKSAPPVTRYWAEYFAIRSLIRSPEGADRVDDILPQFAAFVARLDSTQASLGVAELNGLIAMQRHDWAEATNWYRRFPAVGAMRSGQELLAAWNLLTARALSDGPFELTGADLRDPWRFYRGQNYPTARWLGASATAIALHRINRTDLADHLASWAIGHDTIGVMESHYRNLLDLAGLPTKPVAGDDHLKALIDEVLAVADQLDGIEQ
jgi:predicted ATPase/class 3 adenylate cyclase